MISARPRPALTLATALTALLVVGVLASAKIVASSRPVNRVAGREPLLAAAPAAARMSAGGTARHRLTAAQVLDGFATSYLTYLDGGPLSGLRNASITAASQAADGGRIPGAFRDGPLRITSAREEGSTGFSAQATVVAGNRSESYPFTVQMLYEQNGWQIAQVVPVDLSTDHHIRPPVGVVVPQAGQRAARRFAVAYVNYRAGETRTPPRMGSDAARQVTQDTDSLAQTPLPRGRAVLASISFGPPSGREFAATATARVARDHTTFSFLMIDTRRGWVCGAFL